MIPKQTYKGIDYIRVGSLPEDQKKAIQNWLNGEVIIKIQTDSATLLSDCIVYKDYEHWYNNIFTSVVAVSETAKAPKKASLVRRLVFE